MRPALVLILPKTSYRQEDLIEAAERAGAEVVLASDRCHVLAKDWSAGALPLELSQPAEAAAALARAVQGRTVAAVLGVDEQSALVAARTAELLGLPHNPPGALEAARNKAQARARWAQAGLPGPWFETVPREIAGAALDELCGRARFPCVVKPLSLSGSRGVLRADDAASLRAALARAAALLRSPQLAARRDPLLELLLVEGFLPGPEIALEGLLTRGALEVLAIFDKPDPLDGPFFEETLYVTPSRHPPALQAAAARAAESGARALGLVDGPVHAELRLSPAGPRLLEVAARSIGGLCGRVLRFGAGVSLEDLVVRHALARGGFAAAPPAAREAAAAGVAMLPIRRGGILREVRGVAAASGVPGIAFVSITAHLDEELVPLPEGSSYLGFVFARASDPAAVEAALRAACARIEAVVTPRLPLAGSAGRGASSEPA